MRRVEKKRSLDIFFGIVEADEADGERGRNMPNCSADVKQIKHMSRVEG